MPLFTSSQIDQAVAKATSEMNTSEDWETIMDIVDKVQVTPNGPKDCLRSIIKRLNSNVPHHILHALTLLDVCIKNCGKNFHLQVCSKDFEIEVKKLLNKKSHPIVVDKLKIYLENWSEMFKNDSELSLMVSLYNSLKNDKEFQSSLSEVEPKAVSHTERSKESSSHAEEEDLAKAIELSLKDSNQPKQSSLYPSSSMSSTVPLKTEKEPRKVRALYDFIAAEENEITFKEGELLLILDDSDANWWKGSNHRGEGLLPANFVTSDLNAEKHENVSKEGKRKSVQFDDDVKIKEVPVCVDVEEIVIEEAKIDTMLHMLHEADPTVNNDPDELIALEDRCLAMGPLIDKELVQIDRRHASLSAANNAIVESLNMYEALMKDFSPHTPIPFTPYPPAGYHSPPQQHIQYMNYSGTVPAPYHSAEAYQPMHVPSSGEHFRLPVAGSLPNLQSGMMPNSQPHIPYGANLNSRIPHDVSSTGGNYQSLPSREPSGMYYGEVANSMQHNATSIPMQHPPHVMKLRD